MELSCKWRENDTISLHLSFNFSRIYRRYALTIYSFLSRAYHYPDTVVDTILDEMKAEDPQRDFHFLHRQFYDVFQRGFCVKTKQHVTINTHTFSHLWDVRQHSGELWQFSAEEFEALYSVLRRCYRVGTPNTCKQAMENFYVRNV